VVGLPGLSFAKYNMGEGNVLSTLLGNFFLCKTNEEIKIPAFLIICTNELRKVL
jgi:hypothetical protein